MLYPRASLPESVPNKERTERLNKLGGLLRLPHRLHDVRQGMQLATDQSNEKIVVVEIQAMTGETNVMGQVGVSVRPADRAMFTEYGSLLMWWKFRKGA